MTRGILGSMGRDEVNTRVEYLYRDGSNYKQWNTVVFRGPCAESLRRRLINALDSGQFFIAHQVRLPELFFADQPYADDHCWHELSEVQVTDEEADDALGRTLDDFVREVEDASRRGWAVFDRLEYPPWRHAVRP